MLRQTLAVLVLTGVACSDAKGNDTAVDPTPVANPEPTVTEPAAPAPARAPAKSVAGITGKISFEGEVPERTPVDMSADSNCVDGAPDGVLTHGIIRDGSGGLADVFLQLTDGVPDEKHKAPKEPVVLDQHGCSYTPHVFGLIVKQDIRILNSDATLHNIHAVPKRNKEFNVGMPEKGMEIDKTFKKAEEAIVIKCDVHPWMKCYAFAMEHPYFAVTAADGSFTLPTEGLADGDYGVKGWHEILGEFTGTVSVSGGAGSFEHTWTR